MKKLLVFSITLLLVQSLILSAEEKKAEDTFVYATYFYCDPAKQDDVDAIVEKKMAPVYGKAVDKKVLKSWAWLKHHTGGQWRRVMVTTTSEMKTLLPAQDQVGEMMDAAKVDKENKFGSICNAHDDYIWKVETGSKVNNPGNATLSVYMICDMSQEERADEIVKTVFAPIYEANMGEGKLSRWGWLSHMVGGEYRRLLTMSADNYSDLMSTRGKILETLYADDGPAEAKEMSKICTSHTDYLWDS